MKKNTFYSILFIATMVTVPFLAHFPDDYETAKAEAESVNKIYKQSQKDSLTLKKRQIKNKNHFN